MRSSFKATLIAAAFFQTGCVATKQSNEPKFFVVEDTKIALLTNDMVIDCNKGQLASKSTCVKLTGVNRAEKTGKLVAYGLMLEEAGWILNELPMDDYIPADPLKTPAHIEMTYKKWTLENCAIHLKFIPSTNLKTSNRILTFSASDLRCAN